MLMSAALPHEPDGFEEAVNDAPEVGVEEPPISSTLRLDLAVDGDAALLIQVSQPARTFGRALPGDGPRPPGSDVRDNVDRLPPPSVISSVNCCSDPRSAAARTRRAPRSLLARRHQPDAGGRRR